LGATIIAQRVGMIPEFERFDFCECSNPERWAGMPTVIFRVKLAAIVGI
jgi:hypothetical protein